MPQKGERDMRSVRAHANKLRIARGAMGASEGGIVKCLDDIRLALRVRTEEDLHTRIEVEVQFLIVTVGTQL